MIHRERLERPTSVYPIDPWRIVEKRFYPDHLAQNESIFALANGYLGIRGAFEEGKPAHHNGTFVNGFYESWPIVYGETAFGFARRGQTILNVTDGKLIRLYVDDEPFFLPTARLLEYERALDMRRGTLDREILWETPAGKQVSIRSCRLVSLEHRHLAAIRYEIVVRNARAPVVVCSELRNTDTYEAEAHDPRRPRGFRGRVLLPRHRAAADLRIVLGHAAKASGMTLATGIDHLVESATAATVETEVSADEGKVFVSVNAEPGEPIVLTKFIAYHNSRSAPPAELATRVGRTLDRAKRNGWDDLLASQRRWLDTFWERSDVEFRGDPAGQQAVRFSLFQLAQATARAEGVGVPAKGLTGQGYEGHYFWDTEIYVLPFLIYTRPRAARNLLRFRLGFLDRARERAREVNQRGALFPWRTINGAETSAYYAAGTAQYHINADIAYALRKYVQVTGDETLLLEGGAEMLVETARLWADLGFFSSRRDGKFCIHGVTGPDEYNTVVDNNTYTNLMARENLWYAVETVRWLREAQPVEYETLVRRTDLEEDEPDDWQRAADAMYIPSAPQLGIHPQDDTFLDKKPWDFAGTPPDKYPLLLHFHPLVIYRHKVIKQADVVLALFLLGDEFSESEKRRNFEYYDPLTTGDSSLSASIQSIVAFELGELDLAYDYARYSILMDLADVHGNVADGCHVASMGGTWMVGVYGFAGMRDHDGRLRFRPRVPRRFDGLRFRISVRGSRLEVDIDRECVTYRLLEGGGIEFDHNGERITLTPQAPAARRRHE
jgi:alpha,alpha-trehalose phosphorylase